MGLTPARADLDIMRKAGLQPVSRWFKATRDEWPTLMAACRALAISLSCSKRGLLPRISGSQNWPTAPFMWVILP